MRLMFFTKGYLITVKILLVRILVILGISIMGETIFWASALPAQVNVVSKSTLTQPHIKKIEFIGNTVFSDSTLEKIVASYKGQPISLELLQRIGQEIDAHYLKEGFLTSGSFVPPQDLQDGIIQVQIVEVTLEDIRVEDLRNLKIDYVKSRLPKIGEPLNILRLLEDVNRLQNDPLIKEISVEVTQENFGKNVLLINIEENPRFDASLRCTDGYSRSIGSFGCNGKAIYNSALFLGDRIILDGTLTEGLLRGGIGYFAKFNKSNGEVSLEYNTANNKIVQKELEDLGIRADYESFELNFSHFVISNSTDSLKLGLGLQYFNSETFVLEDISFSFVEGLEDGKTKITALNFNQEYIKRTDSSFLAINSDFNVGIDAFGATKNVLGIDGIYWLWRADIQYLIFLDPEKKVLLATRIAGQLTPDQLLPLSQITIGGQGTVRGILRNLGIGDNGVVGNIELQVTVVRGKWGSFAIIPFIDAATTWNNGDRDTPGTNTFVSAGIAARYRIGEVFEARVDFGIPLNELDGFGATDTQDNFIFSFLFNPLKI